MTTPTAGPVPSKAPQDLLFNAEAWDRFITGSGTWTDRLGTVRRSLQQFLAESIGVVGKATKADLDADLAHPAQTVAWVLNDPAPANNVAYRKTGGIGAGAWVQASDALLNQMLAAQAAAQAYSRSIQALVREGDEVDGYALAMLDEVGRLALGITDTGDVDAPSILVDELAVRSSAWNYDFAVADEDGNVLFGVLDGQVVGVETGSVTELQAFATSMARVTPNNADHAALVWDYNGIIGNGQSLMCAMEAYPKLSATARLGNLMFGSSVRPSAPYAASFSPVGGASLQPLVATVQDTSTGAVLSDGAVAALSPGNLAYGESPVEALANGLKRGFNDHLHVANSARALVVSNVSVSGQTIEALSKGASPNLYNRFLEAVQGVQTLATAASKTYGVAVVALAQGEHNYTTDYGGDTTQAGYKAKFLQWISDMAADAMAITGQAREPLFLTYQTSGNFTRDAANMSVGMAQWRATKERRNLYMVAPSYPFTDKGGHLDANGSRWLGTQFAKAARWATVHRMPWRPLEPVQVLEAGMDIYVAYRVPKPPLRFALPYVVNDATDFAAKGFRVQDDVGYLVINAVEIVAPCVIRIRCASMPVGTPNVWYASQTVFSGNGCVCDSDDTLADDLYEYLPGSGMYSSANIPALVGKPYPLANWSIAFRLAAGFKENA